MIKSLEIANSNGQLTRDFNQFRSPCFFVFFSSFGESSAVAAFPSRLTYKSIFSSSKIKSRLLYGRYASCKQKFKRKNIGTERKKYVKLKEI